MSAARKFVTLDGLRGIAALAILTRHLQNDTFVALIPRSYLAVDFFFLLSGFVLAHAYLNRFAAGWGFQAFLTARLIRLWPLYALGTLLGGLYFGFKLFADGAQLSRVKLAGCAALNLAFVPCWPGVSIDYVQPFPLNGPSWSLWWELMANATFAALAILALSRSFKGIAAVGALLLVVTAYFNGSLEGGWSFGTLPVGLSRVTFSFFAGLVLYRIWLARGGISLPAYASALR